jgi:hypothetical protein
MEKPTEPIKPEAKTEEVKTEPIIKGVPEEAKGVDILEAPYITNPFFYEITNYFGIEQQDYDNAKEKLAAIVDWAFKDSNSKKPEDILASIRKAEDVIQPPQWGEKRYTNLYRYIRLASQKQAVQKAMSAFERKEVK